MFSWDAICEFRITPKAINWCEAPSFWLANENTRSSLERNELLLKLIVLKMLEGMFRLSLDQRLTLRVMNPRTAKLYELIIRLKSSIDLIIFKGLIRCKIQLKFQSFKNVLRNQKPK
jgi:hypothetical protein